MISVIIPARNESEVIKRALYAITRGASPSEIEIIVVCNGCTDDTAKKAREFDFPVRVIETRIGGKTNSLNLGDEAARFFPRFYVDADVVITIHVLRAMVARLARGDVHAVAPRACVDLNRCSWLVRAYYHIRSQLPSCCEGIGGSGVYGLSETGRNRFAEFPGIVADDVFVRIQFKPEERETLGSVSSTVFAPRRIKGLIAIRTRAYVGVAELSKHCPDLWKNIGNGNKMALRSLLGSMLLWPKILIYLGVNGVARVKSTLQVRRNSNKWERDNTSRVASDIVLAEDWRVQ